MAKGKARVMLIAFHNSKAMGVKFLGMALEKAGYEVDLVFFMGFNSVRPSGASERELGLLSALIEEKNPAIVGLSVMTSIYMETVMGVNKLVRGRPGTTVVWGGAYATLDHERCMAHTDYLMRGECEGVIADFCEAALGSIDFSEVGNLVYRRGDGSIAVNGLVPLNGDLDSLGYPEVGMGGMSFIYDDRLIGVDPQLRGLNYETVASRGCPFKCSYCSSANFARMYEGRGSYVRTRSVGHVMDELRMAKGKVRRLKVVRFWDEVFCTRKDWVDGFTERYRKEINVPFEIFVHPLLVKGENVLKMRKAGLYKAIMGIQSGSPRVRNGAFNRRETNAEILEAARALHAGKVPQVVYDLMLRHAFDDPEALRETFDLCMSLPRPFELQMHGLNYYPANDIVAAAISLGHYSEEEMEAMMYGSPMSRLYETHWGSREKDGEKDFWYHLIYLTQFKFARGRAARLARRGYGAKGAKAARRWHGFFSRAFRAYYYRKKARLLLTSLLRKRRGNKAIAEAPGK
ncbi:MAG: radical SAM protein [Oscillospiraceae bacterium]|nr:radical SAM protein [Oscillospiraceae bacterium]